MSETKIIAEVAGRVCALSVDVGSAVGSGDEVLLVEAMKMELPVSAPASGTIISFLVKVDDMVAEGQTLALLKN